MTTTFRPLSFELGDWGYVKKALPHFLYAEDVRGVVAVRKGKLGGMYLFDHWSHTTCQAHHIVTDRRVLVEGLLHEAWGWVFGDANRLKVYGMIDSQNTPSLRLAKRIGFVEVCRLEDGIAQGVAQIIHEVTKDNCRYAQWTF